MNILAFDTATQSCSIALMTDGKLVAESTSAVKGTHTRRLMPMIDRLLSRVEIPMDDLDGFAATVGPGSFTGLRIGISTLKGLAAATQKPIVGVSTLEVLAHQCSGDTEIINPVLDARKNEVYYSLYRRTLEGPVALTSERSGTPEDLAATIESPCTFIGDGVSVYRDEIRALLGQYAFFAPESENVIQAAVVAALGFKRLSAGNVDDPMVIAPHYIRRSDAEKVRV